LLPNEKENVVGSRLQQSAMIFADTLSTIKSIGVDFYPLHKEADQNISYGKVGMNE
jgi:hypothetical protein